MNFLRLREYRNLHRMLLHKKDERRVIKLPLKFTRSKFLSKKTRRFNKIKNSHKKKQNSSSFKIGNSRDFDLLLEISEIKENQKESYNKITSILKLLINSEGYNTVKTRYENNRSKEENYMIITEINHQYIPNHKFSIANILSENINYTSSNNMNMASGIFKFIKDQSQTQTESNLMHHDDHSFDHFSFKIKPNFSMNENELHNYNYKSKSKNHTPSPDRLISHKFFEDTENFHNTNFLNESVKTFTKDNTGDKLSSYKYNYNYKEIININNPFSNTNKSLTDLPFKFITNNENSSSNSNMGAINGRPSKIEIGNNKENVAIAETSSMRDDISVSNCNYSEREIENDKRDNFDKIVSNNMNMNINDLVDNYDEKEQEKDLKINTEKNINNTLITLSEVNDSVSVNSSKMQIQMTSQERAKKVRGFNFKNNINTKKFNKPLIGSRKSNKNITDKIIENNNSDSQNESQKNRNGDYIESSQLREGIINSSNNLKLKKHNSEMNVALSNLDNYNTGSVSLLKSNYDKDIETANENSKNDLNLNNLQLNNPNILLNNNILNTNISISNIPTTTGSNSGERNRIKKFNFNNNLHRRLLKNELINSEPKFNLVSESNIPNNKGGTTSSNIRLINNNFLTNSNVHKEREKQYTVEIIEENTLDVLDTNNNKL